MSQEDCPNCDRYHGELCPQHVFSDEAAPARAGTDFTPRPSDYSLTFFAAGVARPKGSHNVYNGRPVGASKGEPAWRATVALAAAAAMRGRPPLEGCVRTMLEFYSARPRSHYTKGGKLKASAPPAPGKKPDWDKIARSVGDALNGICWRDDALVVDGRVLKLWTTEDVPYPGVRISVMPYS